LEKRVHKESRKIFVATVSRELGMNFLRVLMRGGKVADEHLPLPDYTARTDYDNEIWRATDTRMFLEAQKLVCAPVFTFDEYTRIVDFASSLPITETTLPGVGIAYPQTFEVRFHNEHLRQTSSTEVGVGMEGRKFAMTVFMTPEEAAKDPRWLKRLLGFFCENKYYLVGNP
jgi:hypothetical protein